MDICTANPSKLRLQAGAAIRIIIWSAPTALISRPPKLIYRGEKSEAYNSMPMLDGIFNDREFKRPVTSTIARRANQLRRDFALRGRDGFHQSITTKE